MSESINERLKHAYAVGFAFGALGMAIVIQLPTTLIESVVALAAGIGLFHLGWWWILRDHGAGDNDDTEPAAEDIQQH